MKKGDELFVYGTLLRGERADISKNALIHSVSFIGKDEINGKMYHIGAFPGVVLLPDTSDMFDLRAPTVKGEVYLVGDMSVVAVLDAYEGYPSLYDRSQVLSSKGRLVWVYTYNPAVVEDQLIDTGDWKNPRLVATHRIPNIGR